MLKAFAGRPWRFFLSVAAALALLAACSPALNWREVAFEGAAARASLPCKPDRTRRSVPLGGQPTDLQMAGCEVGGAMFAVMWARLPAGADPAAALSGWRQATLSHVRAAAEGAPAPFVPRGALALPDAVRLQTVGRQADGAPVQAYAGWAAAATPQGVELLHAVLYAPPAQGVAQARQAEAAQALFDGVSWP